MAGFTTFDKIIEAQTVNGTGQRVPFHKTANVATTSLVPMSTWPWTGIPTAGANTAKGRANGRTLTSATTGAIVYGNPSSGTNHLIGIDFASIIGSSQGTYILVDRIADCNVDHAEATGAVTGVSATSRLGSAASGHDDCAMIWCEVTTAFSGASNTVTFTYTNQDGTSGQVTQGMVTTASQSANKSVNSALWQGLASGDRGVRSIETITLSAGSATGAYNVCLVRPLAYITFTTTPSVNSKDCVVELPNPMRIYDNSCLTWLHVSLNSSSPTIVGNLILTSN